MAAHWLWPPDRISTGKHLRGTVAFRSDRHDTHQQTIQCVCVSLQVGVQALPCDPERPRRLHYWCWKSSRCTERCSSFVHNGMYSPCVVLCHDCANEAACFKVSFQIIQYSLIEILLLFIFPSHPLPPPPPPSSSLLLNLNLLLFLSLHKSKLPVSSKFPHWQARSQMFDSKSPFRGSCLIFAWAAQLSFSCLLDPLRRPSWGYRRSGWEDSGNSSAFPPGGAIWREYQ